MAADVAELAIGDPRTNLPAIATEELDSGSFLISGFELHDSRATKEGSRLLLREAKSST